MSSKNVRYPFYYTDRVVFDQFGDFALDIVTTVDSNKYFNNGDIACILVFNDDVNVLDFLMDSHFYSIKTFNDSHFTTNIMKLSILGGKYIFNPISDFVDRKPIVLSKKEALDSDAIVGKVLFTVHDYNDLSDYSESFKENHLKELK